MPVLCLFLLRNMPLELTFALVVHLEEVICSFRPFARALLFFVPFSRVVTEVNSFVLGVLSRFIQELVRSDSCEQLRTWGCAFAKWSLTMGVRGDLVGDGVQPLRRTPRTPGLNPCLHLAWGILGGERLSTLSEWFSSCNSCC